MAKENTKAVAEKVTIKSNLESTLIHNGIEIASGEMVIVDEHVAKELVDKKFCTIIKVKAV